MNIDQVIAALPDLPSSFTDAEMEIVRSIAAALHRDSAIDEFTWSMVQRYAFHRAKWDALHVEVMGRSAESEFLSGHEQQMAYHHSKCSELEEKLLGTPKARAAAGLRQPTFIDTLIPHDNLASAANVSQFQPLAAQRR